MTTELALYYLASAIVTLGLVFAGRRYTAWSRKQEAKAWADLQPRINKWKRAHGIEDE